MIRAIVIAGYVGIVVAMVVLEIIARKKTESIAPLGEMLNHATRSRTVRIGIIAAWWWFGWHFLFAPTVQMEL